MEMEWVREKVIGHGGQAVVFLAKTKPSQTNSNQSDCLPPLMAIKSADIRFCEPLMKESQIFSELDGCKYIIKCYGDELSLENNSTVFNLFLEFAPYGSLSSLIKRCSAKGVGLPEYDVIRYTHSILQGLKHIHGRGFVHRDIKPHNILICENNVAKIADFGFSTKANKQKNKDEFRLKGTTVFMAPESIAYGEYEPACDVWALGCVVLEMLTGKPAWNFRPKAELNAVFRYIACSGKSPSIPLWVSKEAKSFLENCFIRDPKLRWSADMLLSHPFAKANTEIDHDVFRQKITTGEEFKRRPDGMQRYFCARRFAEASQSIKATPSSGGKRKRTDIDAGVENKAAISNSICRSTVTNDGSHILRRYWCNRKLAEVVSDKSVDVLPF